MNSTESAVSKSRGSWWTAMIGWIAAVVIAFTVTVGIVMARENRIVSQQANLQQVNARGERVLVMQVQAPVQNRTIELPGTIRGYVETPIYAKTPGYLKAIYVDKGDRVHKGEVMAVLESPELDKEVADARASYWLTQVTDQRYQYLVREGVVAQQTADNSHAAMLQAQALYQQLLAMQGYEIVRAQTDGINQSLRRSRRPDSRGDDPGRQHHHADRRLGDHAAAARLRGRSPGFVGFDS